MLSPDLLGDYDSVDDIPLTPEEFEEEEIYGNFHEVDFNFRDNDSSIEE